MAGTEQIDPASEEDERPRLHTTAPLERLSRPGGLSVIIGAGAVVSWLTRWAIDDTYITFRFARNLADGLGPVYNPGERVEGYTNFLWMVLQSIPHRFGWDPLGFAHLAGLGAYVAIGVATALLARRVLGSGGLVAVAVAFVVWNGTVLRFATSGMETCLTVALVLAAVVWVSEPGGGWSTTPGRLAAASAFAGLAVLTRLDATVVLAVWFGWWAWSNRGHATLRSPVTWACLFAPFSALVGPWLIWKQSYYGSILPNTLTAKSGGVRWQMLVVGLVYVALFAVSYGLVVLIPRLGRLRRLDLGGLRGPLLSMLGVWPLYVIWVGGDWMEFRFMAMYVPFLGLVVARLLDEVVAWWRHAVVVSVLAVASLAHVVPEPLLGVFSPSSMDAAVADFRSVGRQLQRDLPGDLTDGDRPLVAVGAAGAIPYESDLRTIDVLGLTDRTVARTGERADFYFPGHQMISPIRYLVDRGVAFVLVMDGPIAVEPARTAYRLSEVAQYYAIVDLRVLDPSTTVLEIDTPIGTVRALELTRHPAVDALVERGRWRRFPIEFRCERDDITDFLRVYGTKSCPGL